VKGADRLAVGSIQNVTGRRCLLPTRSSHGSAISRRTPYSGGGPSKAVRRAVAVVSQNKFALPGLVLEIGHKTFDDAPQRRSV
jgi:hypothetical protein